MGQNTCFQRSECHGDAESFSPNPSAGQEQEAKPCERKNSKRSNRSTEDGKKPHRAAQDKHRTSSRTHSIAKTKGRNTPAETIPNSTTRDRTPAVSTRTVWELALPDLPALAHSVWACFHLLKMSHKCDKWQCHPPPRKGTTCRRPFRPCRQSPPSVHWTALVDVLAEEAWTKQSKTKGSLDGNRDPAWVRPVEQREQQKT